jgi:hypothetical protein
MMDEVIHEERPIRHRTRSKILRVVAISASNSPNSSSFTEILFMFYFSFNFFELVFHLHQPIFTQLNQLPRLANLYERLFEIDLLLFLKPIRDPLDVLQIFF